MIDSTGSGEVGPESASLGKQGVTQTGPGQRLDSRDRRHALKVAQRAITKARSSALCFLAKGAGVRVTIGPRLIAHVSGIHRCASVWSCPLCAPVVRSGRASDIEKAGGRWLSRGNSALMVTATGPHRFGDPLGPLFDQTCRFGDAVFTGAKAKELRQRLGYVGMIRSVEVTYGDNGWHPHCHALLLFEGVVTPAQVAELRTFVFGRWQGRLMSKGFAALHPVHGLDVRPVYDVAGLSEYLTKVEGGWSVGMEIARGDLKYSGDTPFDLLTRWAVERDKVARALWLEYERVTFGRRAIQWSPGLRRRIAPDLEELTDEVLASKEGEDLVCVTVDFDGHQWDQWVRAGDVALVLRQVEETAAVFMFMAGWLTGNAREAESAEF